MKLDTIDITPSFIICFNAQVVYTVHYKTPIMLFTAQITVHIKYL